jgi:prepilin-type N-terminal cleavage/methylation domain-containing protein
MRSRGFTLVEVLVSLAVLSVGLLGAAGMLLASLRGLADAQREIAATGLLRDLADRIRLNAAGRAAYGSASAGRACDDAQPCGAAERATADRAWFVLRALELDPQITATIEFAPAIGPTAPDRYLLSVRFADTDRGPGHISQQVLVRAPVAG